MVTPNISLLATFSYKVLAASSTSNEKVTPTVLSPNSRQRKSRLATDLTNHIKNLDLSTEDQVEVATLPLRKLGLLDHFKLQRKPTRSGRKLTSLHAREAA